jgi:phage terminase large subunit-like protein
LWNRAQLEDARWPAHKALPGLVRVVVAIDPAATSGEDADETGIIVAAKDATGRGFILDDLSGRFPPTQWAKTAIAAYRKHQADRIVAEVNNGGEMVESTLRVIDPNVSYTAVRASRGKIIRAEPLAALYEQSRVYHTGAFPQLEDQMCRFVLQRGAAGFSPDRVDALVWALTDLLVPMSNEGIYELYRQLAAETAASRGAPPDAQVPSSDDPLPISIDEERRRFAAMLGDRQPTGNETAAHEPRLLAIHNARGNKTDELLRREAIAAGWKPRD